MNKKAKKHSSAVPPIVPEESFLPLSRPALSEQDIAAVADVLRSGWITTGPKAAELEQRFCELTGCEHAIALSSATAAMHLLLFAHGIGPGDEVITPSLTWVSTVNLITLCGATPVFVDVDRETLMTTAEMIEPLITERTRLIIPVHYAGAPLDLDPLRALAERHRIPLVEDAAHGIGASYRGRPVGHDGTSLFSLHAIKNITSAEGGMFCCNDGALAERIRRLKFHGLGVDAYDRHTQGRAPQAEVIEPGFKYNLPDMNAVLALGQLDRLEAINGRRSELAELYRRQFAGVDEIIPLGLPDYAFTHAWHLFIVRLDTEQAGMSRDEFMAALKSHGIGSGLHFRAVHTHKYYREQMRTAAASLPNSDWNSARILSLPLFPDMRDSDVERVVSATKSILGRG